LYSQKNNQQMNPPQTTPQSLKQWTMPWPS
jgi:hypothetical protein